MNVRTISLLHSIVGECVDIRVDAMKNISDIFVNESSTICFTCITCAPLFFWNLTTYQGDTWNNKTGAVVGSNLAAGVTLIDNILTVINSSLIFSKHHRGTLSFHDILSPEHQQHQEYNVYIQGEQQMLVLPQWRHLSNKSQVTQKSPDTIIVQQHLSATFNRSAFNRSRSGVLSAIANGRC